MSVHADSVGFVAGLGLDRDLCFRGSWSIRGVSGFRDGFGGGIEEGKSVAAPFGLRSGLRQRGAHLSRKRPRDKWGTRMGGVYGPAEAGPIRRVEAGPSGWWILGGAGLIEEGKSVAAPFGLRSGLRQRGAHLSRKRPRDKWGHPAESGAHSLLRCWASLRPGGGVEACFWAVCLWHG